MSKITIPYGTAGFRANAQLLDTVVSRCGMLMTVLSAHRRKTVGIMITASHNPEEDNGVKLIDYTGEMIEGVWEEYADNIVNCEDEQVNFAALLALNKVAVNNLVDSIVIIGIDTRTSGHHLKDLCASQIRHYGGHVLDVGVVSTPELQFYVQQYNNYTAFRPDYCTNISHALKQLICESDPMVHKPMTIYIDCANGVGARKLSVLWSSLKAIYPTLQIITYNTGKGRLNHECGADYVEKNQVYPCNTPDISELELCFSLDGDSDRVVCFTKKEGKFVLLNGDKIAVLFASFISKKLTEVHANEDVKCAVIQTAYANGSSTNYIQNKLSRFAVECTCTGVKHLHEAAKRYDIGIYFEANGHGTVLINTDKIKGMDNIKQLVSQVTGDAIGNMLFILYILLNNQVSVDEWVSMYTDYPSKQTKLHVSRSKFKTINADRICLEPHGLQTSINQIISNHKNARAFVRPSGTEDVVRLYVEALSTEEVDTITHQIAQEVTLYVST